MLSNQRLKDENDKEMMDLIRDTIRYEFTDMMGLTTFQETKDAIYENPNTAQSTYTRAERRMENELTDFYLEVLAMAEKNESAE